MIAHTSPAYHSDERFTPAFARLAQRRAESVEWLRDKLGAEDVQAGWSRMSARGMAGAKEPWLQELSEGEGASTAGVTWHDRAGAALEHEAAGAVAEKDE